MKKKHSLNREADTYVPLEKFFRKMKITLFVVLLSTVQTLAISVYSQNTRFTLTKENATIENILGTIEDQSEFYFLYNGKLVDVAQIVSIKVENQSLEKTLNELFKKTNIGYKVYDRQVVLSAADGVGSNNQQQQKSVTGKVTDTSGGLMPGVSVIIKGTTNGSITDSNGKYSILNVPANATLQFSFVGMKSQEISIVGKSNINVTLTEETFGIDEVVAIGYGRIRKGSVSAAISTVNSEEIKRSTSTTTSGALVGKISGITARQKSGAPGSAANIQIRNMGTPLYVIDGIMTDEGAFNNLDINNIDNISILKDGAAAIYGVKAANGVILVTTKRGKKDSKTVLNINSYMGWQQWTTYPDLMNAYQYNYAIAMNKVNRGLLTDPAAIAQTKVELEKWKAGTYNPKTGEDYRSFDWKNAYVSNAAPQKYLNASITGGGEKTQGYLSVSHVDQDAVFADYNFNRTNLEANFDMQLNERLKIGFQMSGKMETSTGPALPRIDEAAGDYQLIRNSLFGLLPTYRPYANDDPFYINYLVAHDSRNIAAFTKEIAGSYENKMRTIRNNINLEYKTPIKGLVFNGLLSYYFANNSNNRNEKGWQEYSYDKATDTYSIKFDKAASGDTKLARARENIQDITGQFLFKYDNVFAEKHHVTGTAGFEFYQRQRNDLSIEQKPVENPFIDLIGTSENNAVTEITGKYSTASMVFRAGYDFKQKYIIDFAGRYDGSWKFPENNRWGFFPSISSAWRISEEEFFKNLKISNLMSNFKLRVSYGEMGDDNLGSLYPDFAYLSGYNYQSGSAYMPLDAFPLNGDNKNVVGSGVKGIPITGLTWMTTSIFDIGMDMGFYNNKLNFEFDVFKRNRDGIAAQPNDLIFPLESGISALPQNLNSDENLGIDGFVKWSDKIGSVKYYVGANLTLARQKSGKSNGEQFYNSMGQYWYSKNNRWSNVVRGDVWMMEVVGVFKNQEQIDNYPVNIDRQNNKNLLPGDLIFKDVNGDKVINNYDKRPLGYAAGDWPWEVQSSLGNKNPLMSLGFNFGFDWKGFDFAADLAGGYMNTFIPAWFTVWGTGTEYIANGYAYNSLNVWKHEDIFDPKSPWIPGEFPALRGLNNPSTWYSNNFYNKNVNYLRLRNLDFGYTLPKRLTNRVDIEKLRFYFEGTNLLTIDNMKDYKIDPEVSGVQGADYPQHRVFTIGLNLTF